MKEYYVPCFTGSGSSWLMNFLLEINILVIFCNDINDSWEQIGEGNYCLKKRKYNTLIHRLLPILATKNIFSFKDSISIQFSHSYPTSKSIGKKIILLVRDGRDTLYSEFRRNYDYHCQNDFERMLESPFFPLCLPMPQKWALYNIIWMKAVPRENLHIVRFEDIKLNPRATVQGILDFLQVHREEEEILRAIDNSSFQKARENEQRLVHLNKKNTRAVIMRKGTPGEWKDVYGKNELSLFKGFPNEVLRHLGYGCPTILSGEATFGDTTSTDKHSLKTIVEVKKELMTANNVETILALGSILLCEELACVLSNSENERGGHRALYSALLKAIPLFINETPFQIEIARVLSKNGEKRRSLALLDDILHKVSNKQLFSRMAVVLICNGHWVKGYRLLKNFGDHRYLQKYFSLGMRVSLEKYGALYMVSLFLRRVAFANKFIRLMFIKPR